MNLPLCPVASHTEVIPPHRICQDFRARRNPQQMQHRKGILTENKADQLWRKKIPDSYMVLISVHCLDEGENTDINIFHITIIFLKLYKFMAILCRLQISQLMDN